MNVIVKHPKIVVCIPCYNEARYIEKTLMALASQRFHDFKVLVSDNASSDGTWQIVEEFCARDDRFSSYRHDHNVGSSRNFNFAREATSSEYILWLGAHDILTPNALDYHVSTLDARPELSASLSAHIWIDEEDNELERVQDGPLDIDSGGPVKRYLKSISQNKNNILANSVLRRRFLQGVEFTDVVGTDRVIASHMAFHGPYANTNLILYKRRSFSSRGTCNPYMERLTGRKGVAEDWSALAKYYDTNFSLLLGGRSSSKLLRTILQAVLRYYLPIKRKSVLTNFLWAIRRIKKHANYASMRALRHRRQAI